MAVAKRVCPEIKEIYADVVYKNDKFAYSKVHGRTAVTIHEQTLENVNKADIIAAYCTVLYKDGSEEATIMTIEQLKQAWKQSKMYPIDDNGNVKSSGTHGKFTEEMSKKTVINRACKNIINSSDDSSIVIKHARETAQEGEYAEVREEISENQATETIEVEGTVIDTDTGEVVDDLNDAPMPDEDPGY